MAIPLIFKRIAIIFYIQAIKLRFLWSKKEDDYFLVTPFLCKRQKLPAVTNPAQASVHCQHR